MKHNLLKSVILSVILLMGVSNAWAEKFTKGEIQFYTNAEGNKNWYFETSTVGDWVINNDVTTGFYLKRAWCNIDKEGGNVCDNTYLHYNLYKQSDLNTPIKSGDERIPNGNWDNPVYFNKEFNNGDGINILDGVVGGQYVLKFYFTAKVGSDCGGTIYLSNNSNNYNIKFTYNPTYNVTVTAGTGGNVAKSSVTAGNINPVTLPKATPSNGYSFDKWTTSDDLTLSNATSADAATVKARTAGTVTANFKGKTYTITLNQQSGTGGTASVTATYDSAMPSATMPTKTGYTFGGYFKNSDGTGTQYYKEDGTSKTNWNITANTTLYAKWTLTTYNITYNNLYGTTHSNPSTYTIETNTITFSAPTTERKGYAFSGWNPTSIAKGSTGNKTITAQWKANTYIVTLAPQGGFSSSNSINATYDATLPAITPPTRDGYIFDGYYSEPNGQGKKYYNADGLSANTWDRENATLYAKWIDYSKCIFFKNNVNWDNVYVYTFENEIWHNGDNQVDQTDDYGVQPKLCTEYGKMNQVGNGDVYYYILTKETDINHIAFCNKDQHDYNFLYGNGTEAVYRGDYSNSMSLFIPNCTTPIDQKVVNQTKYYNKGVWMKYNSKESGYRLNLMGEGGVYFITNEPGGYVFTATVHLSTKNPYKLDITTLQSEKKFSNVNYMTSANCTGWTIDDWDWATESTWGINPTLVGEYTFTMNLAEGKVSVSATYPTLQEETGDYRLLYVEQVVEKSNASGNEWKTVVTRKKAHPSDIIKPSELAGEGKIVSLHIYKDRTYQAVKKYNGSTPEFYESSSNPEVILQRCTGFNQEGESQWEDVERHMVYGPLKTLPGMAMAPGRRNTAVETPVLVYDDGIEAIKTADNNGNGVWNFTVKASGSTATIDLTKTERYPLTTGNYYIRTANAEGAWHNYKIDANRMTYSEYATNNKEFTHYFCKWINTDVDGSKNVQFVIANDYGQAISDTLVADRATLYGVPLQAGEEIVGGDGLLPAKANVRFSWKEDNNALHRAYLNGSGESDADYLVVRDASNGNGHGLYTFDNNGNSKLTDNKKTFSDNGGWMYHADVRAETLAPVTITATYNGKKQYFKGSDSETQPIIAGNANDTRKHPIRILYDFKENRYFTAYVPIEAVTEDVAIETDVMIIRRNHEEANQLQLTPSPRVINEGKTAYGAITFTKNFLSSNSWNVTNDKKFYWISFPFDVKLSEAFGFGKYAVHWYIEYYDGKSRAENGLFYESGTYWKYVTKSMAADYVLEANKGYLLWLNVPRVQSDNFFAGDINEISIYFPSKESIDPSYESYSKVECTLEPLWRPEGSRRYYDDSNWHLIGVPSYANTTETTQQDNAKFVYDYIAATDTYEPKSSAQIGNFKSMFAYMVQYTGNINWSTIINDHNPAQKAIIAQQKSSDNNEHLLRLELQQNGSKSDQTFIQLQEQDVTTKFDMNHDLCKIINAGANIYTIITEEQEPIQVAANLLPDSESIIPVGIKLDAAGEYTFAMPDGTDGIIVELIDYETNTRTNMLLSDYTVSLPKGTNETRFALHVKPNKVVTGTENIHTSSDRQIKKYIIDGALYLIKDGTIYDAQGHAIR